jgi:YYY domain-containing protein
MATWLSSVRNQTIDAEALRQRAITLTFAAVLIVAAILRFTGQNWDQSHYQHPDERFITMVATGISWPTGPQQEFDGGTSIQQVANDLNASRNQYEQLGEVSVGSLIGERLGRISKTGDKVEIGPLCFTVTGMDGDNVSATRAEFCGGYFDSAHSALNPYNRNFPTFIYGTFPLFLEKLVADLLDKDVYGAFHEAGRTVSAIFDLFSILFVYLIGRRLFGAFAGLLAATLLSFTALNIQLSHFSTFDAIVTTLCIATFYFSLRANDSGHVIDYTLLGLFGGLAVASKLSALPILAVAMLPLAEQLRLHGWRAMFRREGDRVGSLPAVAGAVVALFIAAVTFRIGQPYAFMGPHIWDLRLDPRWTNDVRYWNDAQKGINDGFPSIQWANRTPIVFATKNMVVWGMGIPLGITALVALALGGIRIVTARTWPPFWQLVLIGWPTFHIVYYGMGFVKSMRYIEPAYPFLILLAAGLLARLWSKGRAIRFSGFSFQWGQAIVALVVTLTALYGIAFARIYTVPDVRIQASHWFYDNVPPGSLYLAEHWDEGFPLLFPGEDISAYESDQLELYFGDDHTKLNNVLDQLDSADYIFMVSNRLYGSIPRVPERYPMTTEYYNMLFSGELGFELVETFTNYPNLFGIEIPDQSAEEAFTVYDHPKVLAFKKTDAYNRDAIAAHLEPYLNQDIVNLRPILAGKNMLMMTESERETTQASGTWSDMFDRDSVSNNVPILFWYIALQLMALVAFPLCWRVLSGLPDRGYAVAKTIGLLLVSYVAWLLPSLHVISFGRLAVIVGLAVAAAVSLAAVWSKRRAFVSDIRGRWREIVFAEGIFLAAFLLFVWFRSMNPDLWHPARGGEKPMEFAYFNAILRSTHFPPYDPWFAGGYINYYYFGYVPVAVVTRLTGIIPSVAFNLAVPTFFALTVLTAWSFTANVLRMLTSELKWRSWWRPLVAGLLGPLFVTILGNLDMPLRIARGEWGYPVTNNTGVVGIATGIWNALTQRHELPTDTFWASSRVVDGTVNEFPYWTFLFSDLHPHLMAIPFAITALILALGVLRAPAWPQEPAMIEPEQDDLAFGLSRSWRSIWRSIPWSLTRERVWLIGLTAFVTGALYPLNTWDYPTYLGLIVGAFVLLELFNIAREGWRWSFASIRRVAFWSGGTIVLGRLLFWPYFAHYSQAYNGFIKWTEPNTTASQYLTIFGGLLFFVVSFIVAEALAAGPSKVTIPFIRPGQLEIGSPQTEAVGKRVTASVTYSSRPVFFRLVLAVVVGLIVIMLAGAFDERQGIFLVALLALTAVAAWFRRRDPIRLFLLAMAGVALALSVLVERYTLRGDIGRMNTVFKFYLEVWVLLALVAAVGTVIFVVRYGKYFPWPGLELWVSIAVLLVVAGAVYPAVATQPRLDDRFLDRSPTLNGMAYMPDATISQGPDDGTPTEFSLDDDYKAINWLLDNVEGSPVILEAQTPEYRWGSRISIYTGLPTVVGWNWHQRQQRGGYESLVEDRVNEVQFMYDQAVPFASIKHLLDKYHVKYIYVGDLERALYDGAGLAKFDQAVKDGDLTVVYDDSGVKIYEYAGVDES